MQRIIRRGGANSVRYRRAMMILASAGGNRVPVIRKLAAFLVSSIGGAIRIGREALRCLLGRRGITFQRTKT